VSYVPESRDSLVSYAPKSQDSLGSQALGSQNIWPTENPSWSYVPGSRDFPVSFVPGNRFLFLWNFKPTQQHLKQHSFKKLFNTSINYTNRYILYMFQKISYLKVFGLTPRCPKHWGVIIMLTTQSKSKKVKVAIVPGGAVCCKKPNTKNLVRLSL